MILIGLRGAMFGHLQSFDRLDKVKYVHWKLNYSKPRISTVPLVRANYTRDRFILEQIFLRVTQAFIYCTAFSQSHTKEGDLQNEADFQHLHAVWYLSLKGTSLTK